MKNLCWTFFIFSLVCISMPSDAHAGGPLLSGGLETRSPLLTPVANRCVRLMRRGGSETLVNTCGTCKIVGITRKRSGIAMPIRRSFNIQGGTSLDMPFRGPGSSRITSTQSCQDEAADARDADKSRLANNQCLQLKQAVGGKVLLVNNCSTCRGGAVQRMNKIGQIVNRQAFRLKPKGETAVVSQGAAKVSIIADIACPT